MNNRRKLVIALGAGALTVPFASFAQMQAKVWRVGFLSQGVRPASIEAGRQGAFLQGMRELGYVEGKNLTIEWRFAEEKYDRLPELAAELVRLQVDVIVASGLQAPLAAQKSTDKIPIVMVGVADPVAMGLVKSLARPGGNITGPSNITSELGPKRLEMLRDMVPRLSRVALLTNPDNPAHVRTVNVERYQAAGQKLGVTILRAEARTPQEIESAFAVMVREKAGALLVLLDSFFQQQRSRIAELSAKHRLPCMTADRIYVEAGCLMSYGNSLTDDIRRVATYVDKIFKGAKPGDIPVEQPTTFELAINMKTAKALGIKIPNSILVRADKVIE